MAFQQLTFSQKKCCVPTCGSGIGPLHKFPNPTTNPDRFRTWVDAVRGEILGLSNETIYKNRRVCHKHFETRYHTWNKLLIRNAVPTLQLSGFSVVRNPLSNITNVSNTSESVGASVSGVLQDEVCINATNTLPEISQTTKSTKNINISEARPKHGTVTTSTTSLKNEIFKLRKANDSMNIKLKKAKLLSQNKTFQKCLNQFTSMAAVFTMMQFNLINKRKMARRFSKEEKIMALSLYKQGPKAYRWLKKIFILPSPVTLSRMISAANLRAGINENIFEQLKKRVKKMKDTEKLCSLVFDEMSLTPHLEYNRKRDEIIGFVDNGIEKSKKIADHVLVFMIRGIINNYKQPICYTFCAGSTQTGDLVRQIKLIISKLQSTGLKVVTTICDQGTTNVSAINTLVQQTRSNYLRKNEEHEEFTFEINGDKIVPLFDVPHLLKGIRNNLITKDLSYRINNQEKTAKWDHITQLYEKNPSYKGLRLIKKLSENHCNPGKIPKMKVKYASQLFSQTVGKTMGYLAENGLLPAECQDTADIILLFDNLFDSFNGSYRGVNVRGAKPLLHNVTPNSMHKKFWSESKTILKTMKFISKNKKVGSVPSIANWIRTIENMELLSDMLFRNYQIKSIWCRHLNQDPLENFFGSIRSHGIRNISPTCAMFESAFCSLLVNNMSSSHSPGSNCEDDACTVFSSFKKLFFSKNKTNSNINNTITELEYEDLFVDFDEKEHDPTTEAIIEYISGYLLKKAQFIIKGCQCCINDLSEKDKDLNKYIQAREFNKKKISLTYPNDNLKKTIRINKYL